MHNIYYVLELEPCISHGICSVVTLEPCNLHGIYNILDLEPCNLNSICTTLGHNGRMSVRTQAHTSAQARAWSCENGTVFKKRYGWRGKLYSLHQRPRHGRLAYKAQTNQHARWPQSIQSRLSNQAFLANEASNSIGNVFRDCERVDAPHQNRLQQLTPQSSALNLLLRKSRFIQSLLISCLSSLCASSMSLRRW